MPYPRLAELSGVYPPLVNNAGTWTGVHSLTDITEEDFDLSMTVNFKTAFHITRAVLKNWQEDGKPPLSVINMGTAAALQSSAALFAFSASKGVLRAMTQSLSDELGPEGVHAAYVNIAGMLNNDRTRAFPWNDTLSDAHFINLAALGKLILDLVEQDPTCWSHEVDVRPSRA